MPSNEPLLFDPDDLPQKPPDGSLTIRRPAARPLSKEERAFNRAVARVQALRVGLDEEKRRLDRALLFQATELRPRAEQAAALRTDLVRRLAPFLDDRRFKPAQRKNLRRVLKEQLDDVLACVTSPARARAGPRRRAVSHRDGSVDGVCRSRATQQEDGEWAACHVTLCTSARRKGPRTRRSTGISSPSSACGRSPCRRVASGAYARRGAENPAKLPESTSVS